MAQPTQLNAYISYGLRCACANYKSRAAAKRDGDFLINSGNAFSYTLTKLLSKDY